MSPMSGSALKKLKQTYKPQTGVILPPVQRMLLKSAGDVGDRDMSYIHPSEMAKSDWCARRANLRISGAETNKTDQNPSSKMEMIFQEGHDIHHKWQGWMGEADGIELFGKWRCSRCSMTAQCWQNGLAYAEWCNRDFKHEWEYREVGLFSESHQIIGHSDGMIRTDAEPNPLMVEIKSVGIGTLRFEAPSLYFDYVNGKSVEDTWMAIKRPFRSHLYQGMLYIWLAQRLYDPTIEEIIYLYDYKPTQAVKEFRVKLDMDLLEPLLLEAEAVAVALDAGTVVAQPDWAEQNGEICASCEFRNACWGITEVDEAEPVVVRKRAVSKSSSAKRRRAVRPS